MSDPVTVSKRDIRLLLKWIEAPPEECFHGWTTPDECPNAECEERDILEAWYRLVEASA